MEFCFILFSAERLLLLEGGPGSPSCLLGGKHIVSWGFEDMLPAPDANTGASSENKGELFHPSHRGGQDALSADECKTLELGSKNVAFLLLKNSCLL